MNGSHSIRAASANPEVFDKWFKRVGDLFCDIGFSELDADDIQHRVWNCDESGFCTAVASKKILAKRGEKAIHETMGGSGREYITVLACGCADGTRLPPYIVYKGKNLWARWMKNGPAGCLYSVSDSGWMESANFLQWFTKLFVSAVRPMTATAPVVLFFDGHNSHISLELIKVARSNNVHLVCFPPHVTHLIQPLDVSVFAPVKCQWAKTLKSYQTYQIESQASAVTKEDFPGLLSELYEKSFCSEHFKNGFHKCGLHPLHREAIPLNKLSKSLPFSETKDREVIKPSGSEDDDSKEEGTGTPTEANIRGEVGADIPSANDPEKSDLVLNFKETVTVDKTVTPIRFQLRGYFTNYFNPRKVAKLLTIVKLNQDFMVKHSLQMMFCND